MSSNQLSAKLKMLISNVNVKQANSTKSNLSNQIKKKNNNSDKLRESNSKNDSHLNQMMVSTKNSLQNKSPQKSGNSASSEKMQNKSNQNSQQGFQFNHVRANSHNDMQRFKKNQPVDVTMQNSNQKNQAEADGQISNVLTKSDIKEDIKRLLNNQINNNFIQTTSGASSSQKQIQKQFQQSKLGKQSNKSNDSTLQQHNYQQQQQVFNNNSNLSQQNNVVSFLSEYPTQINQDNYDNSDTKMSNLSQNGIVNQQQISNNRKKILMFLKIAQGCQVAKSVFITFKISVKNPFFYHVKKLKTYKIYQNLNFIDLFIFNNLQTYNIILNFTILQNYRKPGSQNEQRSQSTQPSREKSNSRQKKVSESNLISHTEASQNPNQNSKPSNQQGLNKVSQTYDIQKKMITDIENINHQNGISYGHQKQTSQTLQQFQNPQMESSANATSDSNRPSQSAIYKQLQQQKYNSISIRQSDSGNSKNQNIMKQSFQISLPAKTQIKQNQDNDNIGNDIKKGNDISIDNNDIINLNQLQKSLIQNNKNNNITTQSVDSNFKNYLKSKKNSTPEPMRMSYNQNYENNLNQAKFQPQNTNTNQNSSLKNQENNDIKSLQNTLNQFRVRSQTPNSNLKQNNIQYQQNKQQSYTPISQNNNQQHNTDLNQEITNLQNIAHQNIQEYINQNSGKRTSKQQSSSSFNMQQSTQQSLNNQQNNQSYSNSQNQNQYQIKNQQQHQYQIQSQQQHQDKQITKVTNYEYNLSLNNVLDSQNFRNKTPLKLKLPNNSNLIKIQKIPIKEEVSYQESHPSQNMKSSKINTEINKQSQTINKPQSRQDEKNNRDLSSSKNRLARNNYIDDRDQFKNKQQQEEQNTIQRNSSSTKSKLHQQKTPQQSNKNDLLNFQQQTILQNVLQQKLSNGEKSKPQKQLIKKYLHRTKAGCNYNGPKTNQDNFIVHTNVNNRNDRYIFSVCDGHGVHGHLCSGFLKKVLPIKIEEALAREVNNTEHEFIENSLNLAFLQSSKELLESNIDCTFSGSTCVLLLIIGNKMWSANSGDSRAIMCASQDQQKWNVKELSRDHKPDDPYEYQRIMSRGGRVEAYRDQYNNPIGPYRVWLKDENIPGLAMARSFGDVIASQVGVTCEPEVISFTINNDDRFIILASDGVWEFISNEEVMKNVIPYFKQDDLESGCLSLVNESVLQWKNNDEVVDDITCIIIFLN